MDGDSGKPARRARRHIGTVEAATRGYIEARGELDARQKLVAAGLVALAKRVDLETRSAQLAVLHRELRQAMAGLPNTAGAVVTPPRPVGRPQRGSLADIADARAARLAKESGEGR